MKTAQYNDMQNICICKYFTSADIGICFCHFFATFLSHWDQQVRTKKKCNAVKHENKKRIDHKTNCKELRYSSFSYEYISRRLHT